jgi:hypothetical protein
MVVFTLNFGHFLRIISMWFFDLCCLTMCWGGGGWRWCSLFELLLAIPNTTTESRRPCFSHNIGSILTIEGSWLWSTYNGFAHGKLITDHKWATTDIPTSTFHLRSTRHSWLDSMLPVVTWLLAPKDQKCFTIPVCSDGRNDLDSRMFLNIQNYGKIMISFPVNEKMKLSYGKENTGT